MIFSKRLLFSIANIGTLVFLANVTRQFAVPKVFDKAELDDRSWSSYYSAVTILLNTVLAAGLIVSNWNASSTTGLFAYEAGFVIAFSNDYVQLLRSLRALAQLPAVALVALIATTVLIVVVARQMVFRKLRINSDRSRLIT